MKCKTGTEKEFTEEVFGQINQENCGAALNEYENSDIREILSREKIIERRVESCGPDEHHAMENVYVLSPESVELSNEHSDDAYLFEDVSDTDFSDAEEREVNDARSETSSNSVACDNVAAIASNFGRWCQS